MTQNEIKTLEDIDKRSISSIIVVILIVLIAVILISMILTWSKDTVKTKLDDATENMKVLSEFECSSAKYEVEFCNINTVTKNIDFLITNNSGVDFSYFTLSVFGKNISGDPMIITGLFNTSISGGSSKLLSMNSDYYSIVKQDSNLSLLDLDQEYTFNLVSATCPNSVVDLSCTSAAEYTSSPIFSIPDGNYYLSQNVIISTDSDAVIYYTLDGTNPTTSSLVYSSAINLLEDTTTTIKAIAVKPGYLESTVSTGTYIITHTLTTLGASPAAGSYYSIQNVTLSGEAGSTIYYTIDGSTPTTGSSVYSTPISLSATTTLKAISVKSGYGDSSVYSGVYTINLAQKIVFALSIAHNGNFGGLDGADAHCAAEATAAGLTGTFKAWLSDDTTSAASRLTHSTDPYKLVNGTIVAYDWTDFTDGTRSAAITKTATGATTTNVVAWTNTRVDGSITGKGYYDPNNGSSCINWTLGDTSIPQNYGAIGWMNNSANYGFTLMTLVPCNNSQAGLYCFEQ